MKKLFSILLLMIYLGMLYVPYLPFLYYSFSVNNTQHQAQETSIKSDHYLSSDSLIGDICYLKAIKKRADKQLPVNKSEPVNIIMVNNLEVVSPFVPNVDVSPINSLCEFGEFSYLVIEKIKDIDIPPPKKTSFCLS